MTPFYPHMSPMMSPMTPYGFMNGMFCAPPSPGASSTEHSHVPEHSNFRVIDDKRVKLATTESDDDVTVSVTWSDSALFPNVPVWNVPAILLQLVFGVVVVFKTVFNELCCDIYCRNVNYVHFMMYKNCAVYDYVYMN